MKVQMKIKMSDIVKIQKYYIEIYSEEDCDYPNYHKVAILERHLFNTLKRVTNSAKKRDEILKAVQDGSWNDTDGSYKPICDKLRKLGYEIIQGE